MEQQLRCARSRMPSQIAGSSPSSSAGSAMFSKTRESACLSSVTRRCAARRSSARAREAERHVRRSRTSARAVGPGIDDQARRDAHPPARHRRVRRGRRSRTDDGRHAAQTGQALQRGSVALPRGQYEWHHRATSRWRGIATARDPTAATDSAWSERRTPSDVPASAGKDAVADVAQIRGARAKVLSSLRMTRNPPPPRPSRRLPCVVRRATARDRRKCRLC